MEDYPRNLHYFARLLAGATFLLLIAGALVTSNDAGLSVPDWPLSHGQWMPPMTGGVFYEHGHRMIAAGVGLLTIAMNLWLWKSERRLWVRGLGLAALAAVIVQGVLGGMTVLFFLPPPVSVLHASMAPLFFSMVLTLAVVTSRGWVNLTDSLGGGLRAAAGGAGSELKWALAGSVAVYGQWVLGAAVRHSGTVDGTKGAVLVTSALTVHIIGAVLLTAIIVSSSALLIRRMKDPVVVRLAVFKLILLLTQLLLGFGAYLVRAGAAERVQPTPAGVWIATSHLAVGGLLLAVSLILTLRLARGAVIRSRRVLITPRLAEQAL